MNFKCRMTRMDWEEGARLNRSRSWQGWLRFFLIFRCLPVVSLGGLVFLSTWATKAQTLSGWLVLSFLIALAWLGILQAFEPSASIRKQMKILPSSAALTVSINEDGVCIELEGNRQTRCYWQGFLSFQQSDRVLLLYTSKNCFILLPIAALSAEQKSEITALVEQNIVKRKA